MDWSVGGTLILFSAGDSSGNEDLYTIQPNGTNEQLTIAEAGTRERSARLEPFGSTAIFESNPFERRFRDIHTVTQQQQGRKAHLQTVGAFLLGLPPDLGII